MASAVEVSVCTSDEDFEAWRQVRLAVVPGERTLSVPELHAQAAGDRRFYLARSEGQVAGSGMADRSDVGGGGAVIPRVLPEWRRRGVGTALLLALVQRCEDLGLPSARSSVETAGELAFARHFGFVEVDREVEQVREVGDEPAAGPPPHGLEVVLAGERPGLWEASYDTFGREVIADFAVADGPLDVSAEEWSEEWAADPMFLALYDGAVIGCAGLLVDADQPTRAENAVTGVSRAWRGRGVATYLKRQALRWASTHGIRAVYTWTQEGNEAMRALNERLGYRAGRVGISVVADLPLRPEVRHG